MSFLFFNKSPTLLFLLCSSFCVYSDCWKNVNTEGSIRINPCDPTTDKCIPAPSALKEYIENIKNDDSIITIGVISSPWRLYDQERRIIRIEDLARTIKPMLNKKVKLVKILGSWTGVKPNKESLSISEKLSTLLGGFPVSGINGFLWLKPDGSIYTTTQAFTLRISGPYTVNKGDDIMTSLIPGWVADRSDIYMEEQDSEGIVRTGVAWDTFMLCEDRALEFYELAAGLSHSIAAYNAAAVLVERGKSKDIIRAKELLNIAIQLGDQKSKILLDSLLPNK